MKLISLIQLSLTLFCSLFIWFCLGQNDALSFLIGGLTIFFSFATWAFGLSMIFRKKFIALSIVTIVFKYAILGVIIYWLVRQNWLQTVWFVFGVASFALSALLYAITAALKEEKNDVV